MTKQLLRTLLVLLAIPFLTAQAACAESVKKADPKDQRAVTIETKNNGPVVFHVEIADSMEEQMQGLMNRSSMPQDAGMLFVFDDVAKRSFWMKDTLIPLDMIFIAQDGKIHHIHDMAKPLDTTNITSEKPVKAILEINGGLADIMGINEGDTIIHPVFRNQLPE